MLRSLLFLCIVTVSVYGFIHMQHDFHADNLATLKKLFRGTRRRRNAVFTSFGDRHNMSQWIHPDRNYDIIGIYYGDQHPTLQLDMLLKHKKTKFPNLKWYMSQYELDYDYIAVWDDDIEATHKDLNMLFHQIRKYKLDILSPTFVPYHHRWFKRLSPHGAGVRKIAYIEMNTPIFHIDFLKQFLSVFDETLIGWGTDVWYGAFCEHLACKMGISDDVHVHNPPARSDGTREIDKAQSRDDRKLSWEKMAKQLHMDPSPPRSAYTPLKKSDIQRYMTTKNYVVTLQGVQDADTHNEGRLDSFLKYMQNTCGDIDFTPIKGHTDKRRGFGVTQAFVDVLKDALQNDVDVAFVFEDDVQLVNNTFCDERERANLWARAPDDAFVIAIGGHSLDYNGVNIDSYHGLKAQYGAYSWSIHRTRMQQLLDMFEDELNSTVNMISPDITICKAPTTYVHEPLWVWHPDGYSNTWHKRRAAIQLEPIPSIVHTMDTAKCNNMTGWSFKQWNITMTDTQILQILYEYGGVYLNPTMKCPQGIHKLLHRSVLTRGNGFIAAPRKDTTIKRLLSENVTLGEYFLPPFRIS